MCILIEMFTQYHLKFGTFMRNENESTWKFLFYMPKWVVFDEVFPTTKTKDTFLRYFHIYLRAQVRA